VEGTSYEIAIVVMGSYLAYLVAEVAGETRWLGRTSAPVGVPGRIMTSHDESAACHDNTALQCFEQHPQCGLCLSTRRMSLQA